MAFFFKRQEMTFEDHPKFSGVKWAVLIKSQQSKRLGVSILRLAPGVEIPVHTHPEEYDSIYVLQGRGEAWINGSWRYIGEGDYILVPPGEEHGVRNVGDKDLELFIVHSPPIF